MKKGYKVNGVEMVITDEVAEQFIAAGATVEAVKPKIDKTRTKFETLFAPTVKAGFNYLVSVSGGTELKDLTNSTSVSASKKELYALIEDQVENGAVEFEKPAIFFMERGTGGKVLFGMELVLTSDNSFGWVEIYTDDSVEYPEVEPEEVEVEETEAEETEA
jgi:hypothetical protein